MSYILDALNKDQPPGAQEQVAIGKNARRAAVRLRVIVGVVGAALLVNAIVLVWVLTNRDNGDSGQLSFVQTASTSQQATSGTGTNQADHTASVEPQPARPQAAVSTPPKPANQTSSVVDPMAPSRTSPARAEPQRQATAPDHIERPQQVTTPTPNATAPSTRQPNATARRRVGVKDLSASDAQRYRAFNFSTHIFADDREFRAVVINGTRFTEGDQVMGLQLVEITATGVVFADGDREVEVSVLDEWQD